MLGFFIVKMKAWIIMRIDKEILPMNEKLYKKSFNLCNFTNVRIDLISEMVFN